ncbi:BAALC: Brain and acute leukemia cytoplasmic protein [Crotalus adamanteus]|uniref:BAALC: Brain and acute leukemia cytoplasmic protein n=1 Tax=Crotalus adamanteus TaxID=8729 RepID=A0AAW1BME2_CROAD
MAKSSISSGVAIPEKRTHCASQCAKLSTHTTGNAAQKPQNSFKASEVSVGLHSVYVVKY